MTQNVLMLRTFAFGCVVLRAAIFTTCAHTAQAGINVWQTHGPEGGNIVALAIDPETPRTLYAGTFNGGVFKSTDACATWAASNTGLITSTGPLVIDLSAPSTVYAGTQGGGVFSIQQVAAKVVGAGTAASCTDAALDAALSGGGLVTFDCGPAPVTIDISTGTGTKHILADTIIDGDGIITISGGNSVGVFSVTIDGVNFTLQNLTIANGSTSTPWGGGGILNGGGSLTVTNSIFIGNSAPNAGGGISNSSGFNTSGSATVTNSTFIGDSAPRGGGIFNGGGSMIVTNSTFIGNSASDAGGGIFNGNGSLIVANSTFTGNSAGDGGGILNFYSCNACGSLTVTNSTFIGNSARVGAGVANASFEAGDGPAPALLRNTVLANGPSGDNCSRDITDGGHNIDDGTSCGFSAANGSLNNTDPQLDPAGPADNGGPTQTVALCTDVDAPTGCTAASPAIAAGNQAVCAAAPVNNIDQRGFVRPGSGHASCSIGAYEADGIGPVSCIGDCDANGSVTVDEIITLVNIALGNAQPAACPHGIPNGAAVDIALIIEAVNDTLNDCGSSQ